ncbi:MAG: 50S ribosomal protein L3 [Gammaproteobacteria bacterium]|nr:50S ribosomal protein L3 [Gammaproteobacteria bacterium]
MSVGLVGKKIGMTEVFAETGKAIPVTVVHIEPNYISQIKTKEIDGYCAVQIATGKRRVSKTSKAMAGHFAKAHIEPAYTVNEFRINEDELKTLIAENNTAAQADNTSDAVSKDVTMSKVFTVDVFSVGQKVDVTAVSKGKGFQGGVKRWNFQMQDATHGNSVSHRAIGSTGQCQDPGKVFKGKKMPGQMGNKKITVQNQEIVRVDKERNLLLVKGNIPGAPGGEVIVKSSVKLREEQTWN